MPTAPPVDITTRLAALEQLCVTLQVTLEGTQRALADLRQQLQQRRLVP